MKGYPIDDLTNDNLNAGTDDPSQARAEIDAAVIKIKDMIAATGTGADHVLKLDSNGNIPAGVLSNSQANLPVLSTGDASNYNVNIGITGYIDNQVYTFLPHVSNGFLPYLQFDGLGQFEIFVKNSANGNRSPDPGMIRVGVPIKLIFTGVEFIAIDPQPSLLQAITFDLSDTNAIVSKGQSFSANVGTLYIAAGYAYLEGEIAVSNMGSLTTSQPIYLFVVGMNNAMPSKLGGDGGLVTSFSTMLLPGNGTLTIECDGFFFRVYQHDSNTTSLQLLLSSMQGGSRLKFRAQWPF